MTGVPSRLHLLPVLCFQRIDHHNDIHTRVQLANLLFHTPTLRVHCTLREGAASRVPCSDPSATLPPREALSRTAVNPIPPSIAAGQAFCTCTLARVRPPRNPSLKLVVRYGSDSAEVAWVRSQDAAYCTLHDLLSCPILASGSTCVASGVTEVFEMKLHEKHSRLSPLRSSTVFHAISSSILCSFQFGPSPLCVDHAHCRVARQTASIGLHQSGMLCGVNALAHVEAVLGLHREDVLFRGGRIPPLPIQDLPVVP
ncbi:hypothetical protein B0H21DRAFT_190891 [Amylocystis lapponica]|nr:hypothetical protein B0H21DRAFT_190891 [Amylocystis lapponica]